MAGGSRALPLTEGLVLDIVDYLLDNDGYGYSTQISDSMSIWNLDDTRVEKS